MDCENHCLLTDPSGLGISYSNTYIKAQNTFVKATEDIEQGVFNGTINTKKYDNILALVNFIENAGKLKLAYRVPYDTGVVEYFRDIDFKDLGKSEKKTNGIISEPISFNLLTFWYTYYTFSGKNKNFFISYPIRTNT